MRQEFGAIVKEKIRQAAEGGETAPSNISMPEIKLTDSQMDIIKKGFAEGKNNKEIARDAGIGYTQLQNTLVTKTEQAAELRAAREAAPSRAQRKWTEGEDKVLTDWYNDPNGDLFETPASLSHRSESAILQRAKTLGLEETKPRGSVTRSPKDPTVYAPEKGSGSGGGLDKFADRYSYDRSKLPKAETEVEGKMGATTFEPTNKRNAANRNVDMQIETDPATEAHLDKMWKNFGTAQEKDIPLISPAVAERLRAINPPAFKKLQQFETEMDYKHGQSNRQWLSDLSDKDIERYRKLYEQAQKEPPRDVKDIKYSIRRMLNPPDADK